MKVITRKKLIVIGFTHSFVLAVIAAEKDANAKKYKERDDTRYTHVPYTFVGKNILKGLEIGTILYWHTHVPYGVGNASYKLFTRGKAPPEEYEVCRMLAERDAIREVVGSRDNPHKD